MNGFMMATKRLTTDIARKCKRHFYHSLCVGNLLFRILQGKAIVYNLSVEENPEYYANGVLVHNCELCAPMGGTVLSIHEARGLIPRHPNCLTSDCLVASPSEVQATSERWYEGDFITIRTESGREITCTPNHPIMTDFGWMAAETIFFGALLISTEDRDGEEPIVQAVLRYERTSGAKLHNMLLGADAFHGDTLTGSMATICTHNTEDSTWTEIKDAEAFHDISRDSGIDFFHDKVVEFRRDHRACLVYNMQTADGWYIANGIVTHNCRCAFVPANVGENPKGQKRSREEVAGSVAKSIEAEGQKGRTVTIGTDPKTGKAIKATRYKNPRTGAYDLKKPVGQSLPKLRKDSTWTGADRTIAKKRPKNIFSDPPEKPTTKKPPTKVPPKSKAPPTAPGDVLGGELSDEDISKLLDAPLPQPGVAAPTPTTTRVTTPAVPLPQSLEGISKIITEGNITDVLIGKNTRMIATENARIRSSYPAVVEQTKPVAIVLHEGEFYTRQKGFFTVEVEGTHWWNKIDIATEITDLGFETGIKYGRFSLANTPARVYRHEYGHQIHDYLGRKNKKEFARLARRYRTGPPVVSEYAQSNAKEMFAESFMAYSDPVYVRGGLPKDIEAFFDKVLK